MFKSDRSLDRGRSLLGGIALTVLLVSLALAALAADAQEYKAQQARRTPVIGFLVPVVGRFSSSNVEALSLGLRDLGYQDGRNVRIEYRHAKGSPEHLSVLLAELVRLKVDVIVTWTTPAALAAKHATNTIPIVAQTGDPVGTGLVASLAQPGGNVTGVAILTEHIAVKNLELLKEVLPAATSIAVFTNSSNRVWTSALAILKDTAVRLGIRLAVIDVRQAEELERAFAAARGQRVSGILVLRDALFSTHQQRLVELAAHHRMPGIYGVRDFVDAGGLMSNGVDIQALFRSRMAMYVDKILKGAKPAELPIEQPTKFELAINLRTARTLGLAILPALLLRADHVVE